jgi:hypothetical protein
MKDTATLSKELGISAQSVNARARILGIKGQEIKEEGKNGRPRRVFSPEESAAIANYGKAQTPTPESDSDDDKAIDMGAMVLRNAIGNPLAQQFGVITNQLDAIEDQASTALAARVKSMPNRIMLKTAQKLKGYESLDLATIVGVLGTQTLALPARKIDPSLI